jgi:hypothetical protein
MSISKPLCANPWTIVGWNLAAWLGSVLSAFSAAINPAGPNASAEFTITDAVLRPRDKLPPLAGDPRASNREKMTIDLQRQEVPASALAQGAFRIDEPTGGGAHSLPPGSIFLYVFEAAQQHF